MKRTILLADDSSTIQRLVAETFAGGEFEVVSVSNGDAAVRKFEEIQPQLVLADIYMPGKSGYEVCAYVKNHSERGGTPVILLAGAFDVVDERTVTQAGAAALMTKPFEPRGLVDLVTSLLSGEPDESQTAAPLEKEEEGQTLPAETVSESANTTPDESPSALSVNIEVAAQGGEEAGPKPAEVETVSEPVNTAPGESASVPAVNSEVAAQGGEEAGPKPAGTETVSEPMKAEPAESPSASSVNNDIAAPNDEEGVRPTPAAETDSEPSHDAGPTESLPAVPVVPVVSVGAVTVAEEKKEPVGEALPDELVSQATGESAPAESTPVTDLDAAGATPDAGDLMGLSELFRPIAPQVPGVASLSDEEVDRIADRVIQKLSTEVIERVSWDVVPAIATKVLREALKKQS